MRMRWETTLKLAMIVARTIIRFFFFFFTEKSIIALICLKFFYFLIGIVSIKDKYLIRGHLRILNAFNNHM